MVVITKDIAKLIRNKLPNVCIVKTLKSKGGSKGAYYCEEDMAVLKLLAEYEKSLNVVEEYPTRK